MWRRGGGGAKISRFFSISRHHFRLHDSGAQTCTFPGFRKHHQNSTQVWDAESGVSSVRGVPAGSIASGVEADELAVVEMVPPGESTIGQSMDVGPSRRWVLVGGNGVSQHQPSPVSLVDGDTDTVLSDASGLHHEFGVEVSPHESDQD